MTGRKDSDKRRTRKATAYQRQAAEAPTGCTIYVSEARRDQGKSLRLTRGAVTVGRDQGCDLVLDDDSVSRVHVTIALTPQGFLIEDQGSTNGVLYMGKKVERATLSLGSRVAVGDCMVDLLPLSDAATLPTAALDSYGTLVGSSLPMRRIYALLQAMEGSDAPVHICGETGTGKELVARAIHARSRRAEGPFVVVDCGALPGQLMESELFGYRKGAFTGAAADRAGAIESAHGGTVFLDELDDLPLELQPKLLRVLESRQVKRLGAVQYRDLDVRFISASKLDLAAAVEQGNFRKDLYYRIAVVSITLPPLRERQEDIPLLAERFARALVGEHGGDVLPAETVEAFLHHRWPGNVRELRNAVERTLALGITGNPFGSAPSTRASECGAPGFKEAREQAIRDFELRYLERLWQEHKGNLSAAARAAGISRNYLRELLRKAGLYDD